MKKTIGFVQESYHTEVLDFLFELFQTQYDLVWYNSTDVYDNKSTYIEKFGKSLVIKPLSDIIQDTLDEIHVKMIFVTYDNLFNIEVIRNFKNVLFIAHSNEHVKYFDEFNIEYIPLTPLLCKTKCKDYLIPFIQKTELMTTKPKYIEDDKIEEIINKMEQDKLIPLSIVGSFKWNNKNIPFIKLLLECKRFVMFIFTSEFDNNILDELTSYGNVCICRNMKTTDIQYYINKFKITSMLFAPPMNSCFYNSQWSGSLAFAINTNMRLIVPDKIAEIYNWTNTNAIITYKTNTEEPILNLNDLIPKLKEMNYLDDIQKMRNIASYNNNSILRRMELIKDNVVCVSSEYGDIFVMNNDIIGQEIINGEYHEPETIELLKLYIPEDKETTVLDIGSNIGSISLGLLSINKKCTIQSFEPQLFLAKMQKDTMKKNNYQERIKIYNNAVGHKYIENVSLVSKFTKIDSVDIECANIKYDDTHVRNYGGVSLGIDGEKIDMISIDSLYTESEESKEDEKQISLIKIDVEGAEQLVIYGARRTIIKHHPVIFYEDNWKKLTHEMKESLNLSEQIMSFDIAKFLKKVGYSQPIKVQDNWLWIY